MLGKMTGPMSVVFSYLDPVQRAQMQGLSKEHYHFKIPVIVGFWSTKFVIIRHPLMVGEEFKRYVRGTKESGHTAGQTTISK